MKQSASQTRLPVFRERLLEMQGNMSNVQFAEYLGLSRQTVGFYLNGDRIPDSNVLRQICEKDGDISADYLLGLSDVRSRNASVSAAVEYTGLTEKNVEYMKNPHCVFNQVADAETAIVVQTLVNDLVEICRENMLDLDHLQMMLMVRAIKDIRSASENGKPFSYNECNDNLNSIGMATIPAEDGAQFYARKIGDAIAKGLIEKYIPD